MSIHFSNVKGRRPLDEAHGESFKALVKAYADDIIQKWVDYFVLHKSIRSEKITRRIK